MMSMESTNKSMKNDNNHSDKDGPGRIIDQFRDVINEIEGDEK